MSLAIQDSGHILTVQDRSADAMALVEAMDGRHRDHHYSAAMAWKASPHMIEAAACPGASLVRRKSTVKVLARRLGEWLPTAALAGIRRTADSDRRRGDLDLLAFRC